MRRLIVLLAATAALATIGIAPAAADIRSNPNADSIGPVTCPGTDLGFDEVWTPTASDPTGHDLELGLTGVAKSLYVVGFHESGNALPVVTVFSRPGKGLDDLTVFCYWPDDTSPTGFFGGDILFNANVRP